MDELSVDGVITMVLPIETGQKKDGGEWRKGGFIVETKGRYPKQVQFDVWNDRLEAMVFAEGMVVRVSFDVQSREWEGRWYTDLRAWKILDLEKETKDMASDRPRQAPAAPANEPWPTEAPSTEVEDDLPF